MNTYIAKYIFGSENSIDTDALYIVEELPSTITECKSICTHFQRQTGENVNIATLRNGIISECFKGTPDELNNAVFYTYSLHRQSYQLLIEHPVKRDIYLKIIRAVRVIMSHLSRSQYRTAIKNALTGKWSDRICTLDKIDLRTIDFNTLNKNMSASDIMKLIAFQIGQTTALLDGIEIYTKTYVGKRYPDLDAYLRRTTTDLEVLNIQLNQFIARIKSFKYSETQTDVYFINNDHHISYNLLTEKSFQSEINK